MQMRINGRYGQHDWTLWPQAYHESQCHFPCIPRYDWKSQFRYLWLVPTADHFTKETGPSFIGSLGKLRGDIFLNIADTVGIILRNCTEFIA